MNDSRLHAEKILVLAGAALLLLPAVGAAQAHDPEMMSERSGVPLPAAYYAQLRRDSTSYGLPGPQAAWGAARMAAGLEVSGRLPVLVIPALFSDSQDPLFSSSEIQDALFDGPPARTLSGFYDEASDGRLELDGTVTPWVRTSYTQDEVTGDDNGLGLDNRLGDYLAEALATVDQDLDLGQFDNDGPDGVPNSGDDDGRVDALAFEFAEVAGSCGGSGVWPHMWSIVPRTGSPYESDDLTPGGVPIKADVYIIESASDCSGLSIQGPGVMAHELGHTLGLPDLYHALPGSIGPENRRWVVGCWGLMAAGTWSCGQGATGEFGPTHFSAWSKMRLGWADVVDVGSVADQEYDLPRAEGSNQVLRVPLDDEGREDLLIEYRTRTGFDEDLPASGVVIYHEDMQAPYHPAPDAPRQYRVSVLEADGQGELLKTQAEGGNRGDAGDAFARDGAEDALAGFTQPILETNAGRIPRVTIHSMAADGETARLSISTTDTPTLLGSPAHATALSPYYQALVVAGGAPPYHVRSTEGSLPHGLGWTLDGDSLVLSGTPNEAGAFNLSLAVDDTLVVAGELRGRTEFNVSVYVFDVTIPEDRLLEFFLHTGAQELSPAEAEYLDWSGNQNGGYDVGDLRAYLHRAGTSF